MNNIKVFYIDDSQQATERLLMTVDGDHIIIPRKNDVVRINDKRYVVTDVVHEFLKHSNTQVIEVHTLNGFNICMSDY